MKEIIYLIGQISVKAPESFEWRRQVREHFENRSDFEIIDPCLDLFNEVISKRKDEKIKKTSDLYKYKGVKLLVPRDRSYVLKSTIAICNLNHYDPEQPMIGTLFELAWYHEAPEKAVIGLYNGDPKDNYICSYPFIDRVILEWAGNVKEAIELLELYYKKR